MWCPIARYRWLRFLFGLSASPEEYQRHLHEALEGLDNIKVIADDLLVYGTEETREKEAEKSHDAAFKALLQRCRDRNLKMNEKKLKYKLPSVTYMGHVFSAQGLFLDPEKVRAVQDMPRSEDVKGVERLLGVVTYLMKFLPYLTTVCEPLWRLTDRDAGFD